jgi:hypothetical protein
MANIVIIDLAKKANVIFIILNVVSQTYIYFISAVYAVFYNKTKKVFKLGSLAKFT